MPRASGTQGPAAPSPRPSCRGGGGAWSPESVALGTGLWAGPPHPGSWGPKGFLEEERIQAGLRLEGALWGGFSVASACIVKGGEAEGNGPGLSGCWDAGDGPWSRVRPRSRDLCGARLRGCPRASSTENWGRGGSCKGQRSKRKTRGPRQGSSHAAFLGGEAEERAE